MSTFSLDNRYFSGCKVIVSILDVISFAISFLHYEFGRLHCWNSKRDEREREKDL